MHPSTKNHSKKKKLSKTKQAQSHKSTTTHKKRDEKLKKKSMKKKDDVTSQKKIIKNKKKQKGGDTNKKVDKNKHKNVPEDLKDAELADIDKKEIEKHLQKAKQGELWSDDKTVPLPDFVANAGVMMVSGPITWDYLENKILQNFPESNVSQKDIKKMKKTFKTVFGDIGCKICRKHIRETYKNSPPKFINKREVYDWLWATHNSVRIRQYKEPMPYDIALRKACLPQSQRSEFLKLHWKDYSVSTQNQTKYFDTNNSEDQDMDGDEDEEDCDMGEDHSNDCPSECEEEEGENEEEDVCDEDEDTIEEKMKSNSAADCTISNNNRKPQMVQVYTIKIAGRSYSPFANLTLKDYILIFFSLICLIGIFYLFMKTNDLEEKYTRRRKAGQLETNSNAF
jgi:hypothetical protein